MLQIKITKAKLIPYIIAVLLFFILCATRFLITRHFVTLRVQNKNTFTTILSSKYYTLSARIIRPISNPSKIQKNIVINKPTLKVIKLNGKK